MGKDEREIAILIVMATMYMVLGLLMLTVSKLPGVI